MMRILHISDTHFGTEVAPVVEAMARQAARLRPDILVLSGDLTQRATSSEFAAAKAFVARVNAPVCLAVPGNHDIPLHDVVTRLVNPYRRYRKFFGERQSFWHNGAFGIVCLDATHPLRHTRGKTRISAARTLLETARRAVGETGSLCVVEHQPLDVKMPADIPEILINAGETAALFAAYRVDIVLSGHVHMPLIRDTEGLFALPRQFILSGAGTALSRRIRAGAPNSFNVIELEGGSVKIGLHVYKPQGDFALEHESIFSLTENGWRGA